MSDQLRVTAVIPAYNEARTISSVVTGVLAEITTVIVVGDGSTDGTSEKLRDLPVHLIRHEQNLGKSRSLPTGFRARCIPVRA